MSRGAAILLLLAGCAAEPTRPPGRPNVILIMTDDQGYGDLGFHGNAEIRTPHLDALARQSVVIETFYVSPVCAPTRASLLTGRYNYRTGVVDTYLGRAMMHPDEVTLAEMLGAAGYRTGIFGKWHLGDNAPLRPIDQGFQEALVHKGGGIGQPSDPPGGDRYFNPTLYHNGKAVKTRGYCTDLFTDAAMRFIAESRDRPFFVYLSTNAPHTPLQVPDEDLRPYKEAGLPDGKARIYAMVSNIDENVGRLMKQVEELGIAENTIVIFLTDNGPQQRRYNAGLRGLKGSVFEGGIRVPCFFRWPAQLRPGRRVDRIAAHIDIVPTLLEACGVAAPADRTIDGRSLLPLLKGESPAWPDRALFFQWHRGDHPQVDRACAVRTQDYKLVRRAPDQQPMLFDMRADPGEKNDLAAERPEIVARMTESYHAWFEEVGRGRGTGPVLVYIGSERENPVVLTRQDWRGPRANWGPGGLGHWDVKIERAGRYDVTLRLRAAKAPSTARLKIAGVSVEQSLKAGVTQCVFRDLDLPAGETRVAPEIVTGDKTVGVTYVEVLRR